MPEESEKPVFVCADAHGRHDLVAGLLEQEGVIRGAREDARTDLDCTCVHLGDLINAVARSGPADLFCLKTVQRWFDVLLVGNHEHPYFEGPKFGGFWPFDEIRREILKLNDEGFLRAAFAVGLRDDPAAGNILITHAGLTEELNEWDLAEKAAADLNEAWKANPRHDWFSRIGELRGGWHETGGILWSDWREPKTTVFRQLVGHTPGDEIRQQPPTLEEPDEPFAMCIDLGAGKGRRRIAGAWIRAGKIEPVIYEMKELR